MIQGFPIHAEPIDGALQHVSTTCVLARIEGLVRPCPLLRVDAGTLTFGIAEPLAPALLRQHVQATLTRAGEPVGELMLTVLRREETRRGEPLLIAEPRDESDRAALWHALCATPPARDDSADRGAPAMPARVRYTEEARQQRLGFLRTQTGVALEQVGGTRVKPEQLRRLLESFVGSVEVPVGVAGPLRFEGAAVDGFVFAPMATTEGNLVASATRGAAAVNAGGGVRTAVLAKRLERVPLFQMRDLREALLVADWVAFHADELRAQTLTMSSHADLKSVRAEVLGRDVHVHFVYETGDAAGQNMTTGCTWRACQWMMAQLAALGLEVRQHLIEANLSSDKKVTSHSFVHGRGTRVVAECRLPQEVTKRFLHVTPRQLVDAYHALTRGGIAGGMVGSNINIANMVAAIFTATGQDIASVHEASLGQLTMDLEDDGRAVYASLLMPSLLVGTVGGGTQLPTQRELLALLGAEGSGRSERLAEIICGFALALDLSTLSAIASDEFAAAHHPLATRSV
jgi:hydroxymethylglutaryl-CoA reductase (NADPH)